MEKTVNQQKATSARAYKASQKQKVPKRGGSIKDLASLKDLGAKVTPNKSESINIGDRTFSLQSQLKDIREEIESSMEKLTLTDNWDQEGAKKIEDSVYLSSIDFKIGRAN